MMSVFYSKTELFFERYIPNETDSDQSTTGGSNPEDPVMVPVVGDHCRTKGSCRIHAGPGQNASETRASTFQRFTQSAV